MTGELNIQGIQLARRLALAGAETALRAPKDRLPFEDSGPTTHTEHWSDLGNTMREHEQGADATLQRLRDGFSLSVSEYWLVMLCAAVERYPEAAVAMGILLDEQHAHLVTPLVFAQLLHAARGFPIEESLCTALGGGIPARLGLLEADDNIPGRPSSHQTIRLAVEEMKFLFGQGESEKVSEPRAGHEVSRSPAFDEEPLAVAAHLLDDGRPICLRGSSPRALRQFALDLAHVLKVEPCWFAADNGSLPLAAMLRVPDSLSVLDLTGLPQLSAQFRRSLAEAQVAKRRVIVLADAGLRGVDFPSVTVPQLGWSEAERIWLAVTGDTIMAKSLATRFRLDLNEATAATRHAVSMDAARAGARSETREELIARHVLDEGARRMGKLVTHLRSQAKLSELVAPDHIHARLRDILGWHRHSFRVFGEMGLGERTPLGRGLTCLFSGPPGTGKTFAAQCIVNELGLNLYRIDLSQVVSKYIGDTEKALATVFDEAESGHGILLFDEADALFGRRSEVSDAHDRYANIEVGFLLQRIEAFEGTAILATNLRSNMDPAFIRRIRFVLGFPMPDATMRRQLWEQSLPGKKFIAPDVDLDTFATQFRLSGGSIQNIGLAAAHMAAATEERRITVPHLVRATYRELENSGQSTDKAALGSLAEHFPGEAA